MPIQSPFPRLFFLGFFLVFCSVHAKTIDEKIEALDRKIDLVRDTIRNIHGLSLEDHSWRTYVSTKTSILLPQRNTFPVDPNTGFGITFSAGQYVAENHVIEVEGNLDFQLAFSLRYRFEFRTKEPNLFLGPVIGYRVRLGNTSPFENFMMDPIHGRNAYFNFGLWTGVPLYRSLVTFEMGLLKNVQAMITINIGLAFFI